MVVGSVFCFLPAFIFFSLVFARTVPSQIGPGDGWIMMGEVGGEENISLQFALKQRNIRMLEETLNRVSNPQNTKDYGKWLTMERIKEIISPFHSEVEKVKEWLHKNEIHNIETNYYGDWILVKTSIAKAERLLNCTFTYFKNTSTGSIIKRPKVSYDLPDDLYVIEFIAGLQGFPYAKWNIKMEEISTENRIPNNVTVVNELYNITPPTSQLLGSQAVVEFSSNAVNDTDLQKFFSLYAPQFTGQVIQNEYKGEDVINTFTSIEANLDIQYLMGIGGFVNTSEYIFASENSDIVDKFLYYTYFVGNQTNPPLVQSISWGKYGGEYDNATVQRINNEFMILGVRGLSIILASGDDGVGCNSRCTALEFAFPSSPYITMVGATNNELQFTNSEIGARLSSGGFSGDYNTPSYQYEAVQEYLNSGVTLPPQHFDVNGRGYPDVSALGVDLDIIYKGRVHHESGTSASAPIFSAIISLLNNERLAKGKSSLGFLNPFLYQNPQAFNDIKHGRNNYLCCTGFSATEGWDPITGLGSPNYESLLSLVMNLP